MHVFQVTRGLFHVKIIPNLHGGSLASSIMSEEGGDLPLVEVQVEVLHCHFPIRIDLVEVIDGHSCNEADVASAPRVTALELATNIRQIFTVTEKAPIRAFCWLKVPTNAFTLNIIRTTK